MPNWGRELWRKLKNCLPISHWRALNQIELSVPAERPAGARPRSKEETFGREMEKSAYYARSLLGARAK